MTLVIVGHERVKDGWTEVWGGQSEQIKLKSKGLFAVSDSVITTSGSAGMKPLLSGLRKVHSIAIQLWKPYFVGSHFRDYLEVQQRLECFIAFSGSTLTATHAINLISEHLGKLQISYARSSDKGPRAYIVQRHCESNELRDSQGLTVLGDDMFTPTDMARLLTASYISEVVEHSINVALRSAKHYRLTAQEVELMRTDFAAGIFCPASEAHRLFIYRMNERQNEDGVLEVYSTKEEVPDDRIAVLGMRERFESRAQMEYEQALKQGKATGNEMFKFLNSAIDEVAANGSFEIDRPSSYKRLYQGSLKKISFLERAF